MPLADITRVGVPKVTKSVLSPVDGTVTANYPDAIDVLTGDYIEVVVDTYQTNALTSLPAGFTVPNVSPAATFNFTTGTTGGQDQRFIYAYKVSTDGSEGAPLTEILSSNKRWLAYVAVRRDVDPANPFIAATKVTSSGLATQTLLTIPAITTTVDKSLIEVFYVADPQYNPPGSWTLPASMTQILQDSQPTYIAFAAAEKLQATAGTYTPGAATYVPGAGNPGTALRSFVGLMVALRPRTTTTNQPPTVDAGPDITVQAGTATSITATASDPEGVTVTHNWTIPGFTDLTPYPTLTGTTTATVNFTVAESSIPAGQATGTLVLQDTVSDGSLTAFDQVTVTVTRVPKSPPTSDAGPDVTAAPGDTVTLDGASTNPNATGTLTHQWVQLKATVDELDLTFGTPTAVDTTVTIPADSPAYTYTARRTDTITFPADGTSLTASDTATITAVPPTDWVAAGVKISQTATSSGADNTTPTARYLHIRWDAGSVKYVATNGLFNGDVDPDGWKPGGRVPFTTYEVQQRTVTGQLPTSDGDGATWTDWTAVRGAQAVHPDVAGQAAVDAYEIPADTDFQVRSRATVNIGGLTLTSDWEESDKLSLPYKTWYFRDPLDPTRNMRLRVDPSFEWTEPEPQAVHDDLIGRADPVVISDVTGTARGNLKIWATSADEYNRLKTLTRSRRILLLQDVHGNQWYVKLGGEGRWSPLKSSHTATVSGLRVAYTYTNTFTEVRAP